MISYSRYCLYLDKTKLSEHNTAYDKPPAEHNWIIKGIIAGRGRNAIIKMIKNIFFQKDKDERFQEADERVDRMAALRGQRRVQDSTNL